MGRLIQFVFISFQICLKGRSLCGQWSKLYSSALITKKSIRSAGIHRLSRRCLSPASLSYDPTSFRSDLLVLRNVNWVENTMIWVWFYSSNESNLPHRIAATTSRRQWMRSVTYVEDRFGTNRSFAFLLCCSLWNRHGGQSLYFSRYASSVTFWSVKLFGWLAARSFYAV